MPKAVECKNAIFVCAFFLFDTSLLFVARFDRPPRFPCNAPRAIRAWVYGAIAVY